MHSHLLPSEIPDLGANLHDARWPVLVRDGGSGGTIMRNGEVYRAVEELYWDLSSRLQYLDMHGIDEQVVSPLPVLIPHWAAPDAALEYCRFQNHAVADFVDAHPDRFKGFGTVPVQNADDTLVALDEIAELGLVGVEIGTTYGGAELGDPSLRDFFCAASDRGVSVLVHPLEGEGLGRVEGHTMRFSMGVMTDTGIAGASLTLSGLLCDLPALRLCLSHGGGSFFWVYPRLLRMLQSSVGEERAAELSKAIRRVWVDTASLGPMNLTYLAAILGRDRLVVGTDFPAASRADPLEAIAELGWSSDAGVIHDNAYAFLGIDTH